jgi:hypothetical protein
MFTLRSVRFGQATAVIALALLALFISGTAEASILVPPAAPTSPDVFTVCCGTFLAGNISSFTNGNLTVTVDTAVFSDPGNAFCGGCLDFVYQIANSATSTDSATLLTAINFTGWSTDVGYTPTGSALSHSFVNGTGLPSLVDRLTADTVRFFFPANSILPPGSASAAVVIQTNAGSFTTGRFVNVFDGEVKTTVDGFQPASGVPEPASFGLLGIGLLAGIAWTLRKQSLR